MKFDVYRRENGDWYADTSLSVLGPFDTKAEAVEAAAELESLGRCEACYIRPAAPSTGGVYCQTCDLSVSLEAELGCNQLLDWLANGAPAIEGENDAFEFPSPPPWIEETPYYQDDDEAML